MCIQKIRPLGALALRCFSSGVGLGVGFPGGVPPGHFGGLVALAGWLAGRPGFREFWEFWGSLGIWGIWGFLKIYLKKYRPPQGAKKLDFQKGFLP